MKSIRQLKNCKQIYKPNFFRINLDRWLMSWVDFIDGVVGILTLGCVRLGLDMKLVCYQAKRNLTRMMEEETDESNSV